MPKNIVILFDGTGNRSDSSVDGKPTLSNVARLFDLMQDPIESGWRQHAWYDAGVGTGTSKQSVAGRMARRAADWIGASLPGKLAGFYERLRTMLELATGAGITENITQGYSELARRYEPGDRIFLFGFSRGAYTARCLAGVISRCGVLKPENARFAADIVQLYRFRDVTGRAPPIVDHSGLFHDRSGVHLHFVGVWDTVASLGLPLWGWWFRIGRLWSNTGFGDGATKGDISTAPVAMSGTICHAMSIDETRAQFFVTPFDTRPQPNSKPDAPKPRVEQAWFRGSHAGVGGGYVDARLADITLAWMARRAIAEGLLLRADWESKLACQPLAEIVTEVARQPAWRLFPTWPRWHPCARPGAPAAPSDEFGALDESVYARAAHARAQREARDADPGVPESAKPLPLGPEDLVFLDPGQKTRIVVDAAQPWCRTGLVLEKGAVYEFKAAPGQRWWDAQLDACGLEGAAGLRWSDMRRWFHWLRRADNANWMELVLTVAHPRHWPLREYGAWKLLRFLFLADPPELTRQLVPVGRKLKDGTVRLRMEAENGMLYAFANDAWLFYENNSGAIVVDVERVDVGRVAAETAPADVVVTA